MGWAGEMKSIFGELSMQNVFDNSTPVIIEHAWALLHEAKCNEWKVSLGNYPKLRTYRTFKSVFGLEPYVSICMNNKYRSVIAQLRSGILPLEVETGRWRGIELENRLCQLCSSGCVEDEAHFLFSCDFYTNERQRFAQQCCENFDNLTTSEKFVMLMQENNVLTFGKFLWQIYEKRKEKIFG